MAHSGRVNEVPGPSPEYVGQESEMKLEKVGRGGEARHFGPFFIEIC